MIILTGNDLKTGDVIWWAGETNWSRHLSDALDAGEEADAVLAMCAEVNMMLQRVPQPTIAAVQGLATAGGCALASSCDLVVASKEARFCLPGTR